MPSTYLRQSLSCYHVSQASWPAACLHFSSHRRSAGLEMEATMPSFIWFLAIPTQVLTRHGKHFTHWAIFLGPLPWRFCPAPSYWSWALGEGQDTMIPLLSTPQPTSWKAYLSFWQFLRCSTLQSSERPCPTIVTQLRLVLDRGAQASCT